MSLPSKQIRCRACAFEGHLVPQSIELRYWLPTGVIFKTHARSVWCPHCDAITRAEDKLDEKTLHAELEKLEKADRQRNGFWSLFKFTGKAQNDDAATTPWRSPSLKEQITDIKIKLQWVYLRKAAPKCLTCGNTGVVSLAFGKHERCIAMHKCGGDLYMVEQDPHSQTWFHHRDDVIDLDIEGNRV